MLESLRLKSLPHNAYLQNKDFHKVLDMAGEIISCQFDIERYETMITDKEKKIGIIMLIASAVVVIVLIVVKAISARNVGIHGSGVSDGKTRENVVAVRLLSPVFYDASLGEDRRDCSLSKPAMLGVYADMIHEAEGTLAMQEAVQQQEAAQAMKETRMESVNFTDLYSRMTSAAYATQKVVVQGNILPMDTKTLTSLGVSLDFVVSQSDLALVNIFYNGTYLDKVRAIPEGSLVGDNSIDRLYSECIVPNYANGTYVAYRVTEDSVELLGGDELLCLLIAGVSPSKVAEYQENGETLDSVVEKGEVSLEYAVGGGEEGGSYSASISIYELCGVNYNKYYVETLGAKEKLVVVHLVGGLAVVENYAVGNLYTTDYVTEESEEDIEDGGTSDEMVAPNVVEKTVPVFTGYYCW